MLKPTFTLTHLIATTPRDASHPFRVTQAGVRSGIVDAVGVTAMVNLGSRAVATATSRWKGQTMTSDLDSTGPIDYMVVEFPGNRMTGEAFPLLVDLVDRGLIRILDLAFIRKETDGSVVAMTLSDVDRDGALDLAVFEGASSGLLGDDDLAEAATAVEPGSSAGVLVYENVWAAPFARALRRAGGQLVASGRIPVQAILSALDAEQRG